jgi:hypothetical protein
VDATAFGPQVHAIHRVVPGLSLAEAVERAGAGFRVEELEGGDPPLARLATAGRAGPAFVVTAGDRSILLTDPDPAAVDALLPSERSAAWKGLDVVVAHQYLIRHLWGLEDTEDVVGYAHDVREALAGAGGGVALLLNPTPVTAVAAVAEAGERMPRKSTLFTPKPATGMVLRPLDGLGEPG